MYHCKILIPACLFFSLSVAAQTSSPDKAPAKKAAPAAKAPASAKAAPFDPALLRPATLTAKAPDVYEVKFVTTAGDFSVKVTRAWAPNGADRFYNLVRHHFYDGVAFFRVLPGFMAQFGLSAYPEVSKVWENATIKDDAIVQSNHRGFLSFATAGPNTRTTQVFINFADNAALDRQGFAPFGKVVSGMTVVDALYADYGEGAPRGRGPSQDRIQREGNAYLTAEFANMDYIKKATIVK